MPALEMPGIAGRGPPEPGIIRTMSFDFEAAVSAPFRMQPGLRRLAPGASHLTPCAPGSRHQREKLAVLQAFAGQALLAREGFDERPALAAVAAHAAAEHPATWRWDGTRAQALGVTVEPNGAVEQSTAGVFGTGDEMARCLRSLPPRWRLTGLLSLAFEEDMALLDGRDGCVPWLSVCLPSQWAPEEKLGLPFSAVHAPVPAGTLFSASSQPLVKLLTSGQTWERFVWTVTGHPRLHAHPDRVDPLRWRVTAGPDAVAAQAWWRTERQTILPLHGLGLSLFTIHVQLQPLAAALAQPERARRVHDSLASMSDEVLRYRALAPVREPLLAWLAARAGPSPA